jgi:ribosomal protein L13
VKASFIPGDLHLNETRDGFHVVVIQGGEILRTRSQKAAAAKFNEIRREMETKYPTAEMTPEEKADMFRKATLDSMIGHNSLGGRKKKTTAGGTRTFGG